MSDNSTISENQKNIKNNKNRDKKDSSSKEEKQKKQRDSKNQDPKLGGKLKKEKSAVQNLRHIKAIADLQKPTPVCTFSTCLKTERIGHVAAIFTIF